MKPQLGDQFNTEEIDECMKALAEMSKDEPEEVRKLVEAEIDAHMPHPTFAEQYPKVAKLAGLIE